MYRRKLISKVAIGGAAAALALGAVACDDDVDDTAPEEEPAGDLEGDDGLEDDGLEDDGLEGDDEMDDDLEDDEFDDLEEDEDL
jgi:hypothetical protein